jgi:hypothetical protein
MSKLSIGSVLRRMKHSSIRNYALPGLTSYLMGGKDHGIVRVFEADRTTLEVITPHSHRYDFAALVLTGKVENVVYRRAQSVKEYSSPKASPYWVSFLEGRRDRADGPPIPGQYHRDDGYGPVSFFDEGSVYTAGDWYTVKHNEIHSIHFQKGTQVLMFQSPDITHRTIILEPFANGKRVPTFTVAPWMFER